MVRTSTHWIKWLSFFSIQLSIHQFFGWVKWNSTLEFLFRNGSSNIATICLVQKYWLSIQSINSQTYVALNVNVSGKCTPHDLLTIEEKIQRKHFNSIIKLHIQNKGIQLFIINKSTFVTFYIIWCTLDANYTTIWDHLLYECVIYYFNA